jgi:hexokinase
MGGSKHAQTMARSSSNFPKKSAIKGAVEMLMAPSTRYSVVVSAGVSKPAGNSVPTALLAAHPDLNHDPHLTRSVAQALTAHSWSR